MPELALTRTPGDRRLYALDDLGTLRLGGMFSRAATAEAGTTTWRLPSRGVLRATAGATDASGTVVGEVRANSLRRGGTLRWDGRELQLRPSSKWKERYALVDGERELAGIEGKSWGKRSVKITVDDVDALDPGLLLFAAFVVRALAEAAAASAAQASGDRSKCCRTRDRQSAPPAAENATSVHVFHHGVPWTRTVMRIGVSNSAQLRQESAEIAACRHERVEHAVER